VTPLLEGPALAALGPERVEALASASPAWLADRRRAAWDAFAALPMPSSQRDEDWRRTDISRLQLDRFSPAAPLDDAFVAALRRQRDRTRSDAAFILDAPTDGRVVTGADPLLAQGVIVTTLEEAAERHPELVQRALGMVGSAESTFSALWSAMWRGGLFVYVPPGVEAMLPVWVAHAGAGEGAAVFPATAVVVDDAAALSLIEVFASPPGGEALLSDATSTLVLGRDARLDYHALQQWGEGVWHIATQRCVLGPDARLRFFGATLGARLQKAYWETILDGRGAESDIYGVCFGDGTQHLDHQSLQAHRGAETRSNLLLKVAVRDRARSVYSGLIDVAPEAVHADGYVQNRNLLLSGGAKADSVPRLEIKANDVRCGHGATAGHVDSDQRFYLMSRGVPRVEAEALIVRAFFDDVVQRAPDPGFATLVTELLEAEIAGMTQAGLGDGAG
jgi:Fe-S cluster assembly protein SufD